MRAMTSIDGGDVVGLREGGELEMARLICINFYKYIHILPELICLNFLTLICAHSLLYTENSIVQMN